MNLVELDVIFFDSTGRACGQYEGSVPDTSLVAVLCMMMPIGHKYMNRRSEWQSHMTVPNLSDITLVDGEQIFDRYAQPVED